MMKIYIAIYESRNFTFEGLGSTKQQALKILQGALKSHTKQFNLEKDWFYKDDIYVLEYQLGCAYRDKTLLVS